MPQSFFLKPFTPCGRLILFMLENKSPMKPVNCFLPGICKRFDHPLRVKQYFVFAESLTNAVTEPEGISDKPSFIQVMFLDQVGVKLRIGEAL